MLRFDVKLIPLDDAKNEQESKLIAEANEAAERGMRHLKKLIGNLKCRKHPSSPNKIRITAIKGGDPKAELVSFCCSTFTKMIK